MRVVLGASCVSSSTRAVEAGDEAEANGISAEREHDGDRARRRLGRSGRGDISRRCNRHHARGHELGGERRHGLVVSARPALLDAHRLAVDEAGFRQALSEGIGVEAIGFRRGGVQESDHGKALLGTHRAGTQ
jgi:hypothetical protein